MMNEVLIAIITATVSLLAGGGGVFAYLSSRQKNKQASHDSTISEWKELYDEMKERLDAQETENKKLRCEIIELRHTVDDLTNELQNYKKYETYINELERYAEHLLHTCKSLITEEAYKNLQAKQPRRNII